MIAALTGHHLIAVDHDGEMCSCGTRGSVLEHLAALLITK